MLECDYLVVGTGASGMAFADAMISQSPDRTLLMIDKLPQPGGHWNHAYDFVKLHQPACYYGVASEKLERENSKSSKEWYQQQDLSSKPEILSYYRFVMDKLVKTGRVFHYPECTYDHTQWKDEISEDDPIPIQSFVDKEGATHQVRVKRRVVDATYLKIKVPSTHPPSYRVDPSVACVPINGIAALPDPTQPFVVVGAGKTGIDAVLHLLANGVDPDRIAWIVPRDAWLANRVKYDPRKMMLNYGVFFNEEPSLKKSLLYQEREGYLLRLDPTVWPEKYNCATVEPGELTKLRSVRNVIRRGKVTSVTPTHLVMTGADGESSPVRVPYESGSTVVDCSSNGLPPRPEVPIFQRGKIVLQPVHYCTICLPAAMIAFVECHAGFASDADRNASLYPVPYPDSTKTMVRTELLAFRNILLGFGMDPRTRSFYNRCRLNIDSHASLSTLMKVLAGATLSTFAKIPQCMDAKQRYYPDEWDGQKFEHPVYTHETVNRAVNTLRLLRAGFVTGVLALSAGAFLGLRSLAKALQLA